MRKFYILSVFVLLTLTLFAQQLPNAGFEDWSGAAFDGNAQPASWNVSNVTQFGFKFNFAHKEAGHTGSASIMVKDQKIGAAGITEVSPGYFSLGQPWVYIESLTKVSYATAGTEGGVSWTYRPDSMSVWIKRTGNNVDKEDFYLLYYAWSGMAKSSKYKGKNGSCTSTSRTNEESDIRIALDGNECGTDQKATQVAEGMWREKKQYGAWTNIHVPIYYMNDVAPTMMNIIFSASNYPNFRANSGLYDGNSLYVDDVELIYAATIQQLFIDDKEWKGFDPTSSAEQVYSLGQSATTLPKIEAKRGAGVLTNASGKTITFPGRTLSGSEITINNGVIDGTPTTITVTSEDGTKQMTYKIKFVRAPSSNSKLANILVNGSPIANFNASTYSYTVDLPYGTTTAPQVSVEKQEEAQLVSITQPTGVTGQSTIRVTAADNKTVSTYTIQFRVAELADNTLQDILVNGKSIPGFVPTQTIYRVSLPTSTTTMPTVEAVSAYPVGEQTITYTAPSTIDGGSYLISVTTPGNQVPKTYKLNFKLEASSYSYLNDLQVEGGYISNFIYDNLTYYVTLPMGTTTLPEITYEPGDEYQTVSIVEGGLDGTTRITVTAANGDQTVYKIVFSTLKSEISTLAGIRINGVEIEDFSPDITQYSYELPVGTTEMPLVEPIKGDEYETVSVISGGLNGTTRITVSAGNGNTTVYQITFSVLQATDATLRMIYLDGVELEGYDRNILEYTINLPQGTTRKPVVTYTPNDEYQTITIRSGSGVEDDCRITVRPQSGASQTYILHFQVATSDNTALSMLYVGEQPLAGFSADSLDYIYHLPEGVSIIPAVRFDKAEESQKVLSVCENAVQTITVTAESGAKRTYTITFIIKKSENAFLKMIYIDGDSLAGFDRNTLNYTVTMNNNTCPRITVDKENGQQVTITTPIGAGLAQIRVTPEVGAANIYTITFTAAAVVAVQLQGIAIDGLPLEEYNPLITDYVLAYNGELPTVTYTATEEQNVKQLRSGDTITLYVQSGDYAAAYTLRFQRQLSTDCTLESISLDGVPMANYLPTQTDYTIDLPAGSVLPVVTYQKANEAQVIYMGQVAEKKSAITVVAESGLQATYTLTFRVAPYTDATLQNMSVDGYDIAFDPNVFVYHLSLDDGEVLPRVFYTARDGQTILLTNVCDTLQQVIVRAESGDTNTYNIIYSRVKSANALLSDILLNGVSIAGFSPTQFNYVDTLPWRTTVVPNVFPIGQLPNQTITTYISGVNGTTHIHVEANNGTTTADYTIAFPVCKSGNTALEDLYLNTELPGVELAFNPEQTDYEIYLPYQTTEVPQIIYSKSEPEQSIDFFSRPLGQTSQIVVRAENGEQRIYNLTFRDSLSTLPNILATMRVAETGEVLEPTATDYNVVLPYGTRTLTIDYTKSFDEQTVFVQPGGVNSPTVLTVKSNRPGEADKVYTITPMLTTQNPAVLTGITVDGVALTDFDPNRFTYIFNRTNGSTPNVIVSRASGVECTPESNVHMWRGVVSKDGFTNTYTIYFHYPNDIIPNGEFTEWTTTAKTGSAKPSHWNAPGDYVNDYKNAVQNSEDTYLRLETWYAAAILGAWPAIVNLATMTATKAVAGGSSVTTSGFINFRNTPDKVNISCKYPNKAGNGALFRFKFFDSMGTPNTVDVTQTSEVSDFTTLSQDLHTDEIGVINGMDIVIDATGKEPKAPSGALTDCASELYVDYIRFSYNSTLTDLKVNGIDATLSGNAFSATLTDPEAVQIPTLAFTGEVSDQAQKIVWADEVVSGDTAIRTATITNYAEDGSQTDYTLEVSRPLDTRNTLSDLLIAGSSIDGFDPATSTYTVHLLPTTRHLPDVYPMPMSSRQQIMTAYADSTFTITVTPEYGEAKNYTVRFVTDLSDNTTLQALSDVVAFAPDTREYTLNAASMPIFSFTKQMDGQSVHIASDGRITVTAENGNIGTYIVTLSCPTGSTSGQIAEMEIEGNVYGEFVSTTYDYTHSRPDYVSFTRQDAQDSVIFVQSEEKMQWQVYGSENHTYTLTYPTTKSSNTYLAGILLNGEAYAEFNPMVTDYSIRTDSAMAIEVLPAEETQDVRIVMDNTESMYTITVKAEDGTEGTYTLSFLPELSSDATLRNILIDGVEISGFSPEQTSYTIVLPTPAVKLSEPKQPSLRYVAAQESQVIELTPGGLGETNYILVKAENGAQREYQVRIEAEPSHNADLTGIIVNGVPFDRFEATRHYYSTRVYGEEFTLSYTADDNFQTVQRIDNGSEHTLRVIAQDGVTTQDYVVEVFSETQSNDATLANILLDGLSFVDFERALNPGLTFASMQNSYTINLPIGSTILPEVSAMLHADGQSVSISVSGMTILLDVTAKDGITTNRYTLNFEMPLSTNSDLSMIYIDGDSISGFAANTYYYMVTLPVGVHSLPEVAVQKSESTQSISTEIKESAARVTISVLAEDGVSKSIYTVVFEYTRSDADTLALLYADGVEIEQFEPSTFYYTLTLPVGTQAFPELSWEKADEWQTVRQDTVKSSGTELVRQITVTSESGRSNNYTISYEILLSSVDTLQMIYVDQRPLAQFSSRIEEYWLTVAASTTEIPDVLYTAGDEYQSIQVFRQPDITTDRSLGEKVLIEVTAEGGQRRTYTIHFLKALSDDATLNMILVGGQNISNYDSERYMYRISLPMEATAIPVVTVIKKEATQQVEIGANKDTVWVYVTAESGATQTYTLVFDRVKSANANLADISLSNGLMSDFEPTYYDYQITIPYGQTELPDITTIKAEEEQQVEISEPQLLSTGEYIVSVTVTAPNGEDQCAYTLTFTFAKNNDADLLAIYLRGELLEGYNADTLEYVISYPAGYTEADYLTLSDVSYQLSDSLATASVSISESGTIIISVTAQDGSGKSYVLRQVIMDDTNNRLSMIYMDDVAYADFDPEVFFYTYYIVEGNTAPMVSAEAESSLAEVSIKNVSVGDTCIVICTSESGESRRYYIWFAQSELNDALQPTANDVLVKRVAGSTQILVATTRKDVSFGLYDMYGHLLEVRKIDVADPNDIEVVTDVNGKEKLNNITDVRSGTVLTLNPNQIYFYVFFVGDKAKISSGKLIIVDF